VNSSSLRSRFGGAGVSSVALCLAKHYKTVAKMAKKFSPNNVLVLAFVTVDEISGERSIIPETILAA
jgi:hypothetical protein